MSPRISVLLPVYNRPQLVRRAVSSIQAQTFRDWELIIVDDSSTDHTPAVLAEIATTEPRVRVVRSQINGGTARACNLGLGLARGGLIARLDSDDIALPERLARQVAFLDTHPEITVLGSSALLINQAGQVYNQINYPETHQEILRQIYQRCPMLHPTLMIQRAFFEQLGPYQAELRDAQDWEILLRGMHHFQYHNLQEPLIQYRAHSSTLWDVFYGARVQTAAIWRDRQWMQTHHIARFILAGLLIQAGVYTPRYLRRAGHSGQP